MSVGGRHRVYQIYYDSATKDGNDKGFLQLDNLSNERPDWAEYWPIRKFLLANELDEGRYYAFLSPKFRLKTGLGSTEVYEFLSSSEADVVAFSPFYDASAFAINVFEQAAANHRGIYPTLVEAFGLLDRTVDIKNLVMTSRNTVFCNYFAAKGHVWQRWLSECEKVFSICEANDSALAEALNSPVKYDLARYPAKVFVIERIISYLLATGTGWTVRAYNPMEFPYSRSVFSKFKRELSALDALKIAYCETGYIEYIHAYGEIRSEIVKKTQGAAAYPVRREPGAGVGR